MRMIRKMKLKQNIREGKRDDTELEEELKDGIETNYKGSKRDDTEHE